MTIAALIETLMPYYLTLLPDERAACRAMSAAMTMTTRQRWWGRWT